MDDLLLEKTMVIYSNKAEQHLSSSNIYILISFHTFKGRTSYVYTLPCVQCRKLSKLKTVLIQRSDAVGQFSIVKSLFSLYIIVLEFLY